jgi:hypothetical protein
VRQMPSMVDVDEFAYGPCAALAYVLARFDWRADALRILGATHAHRIDRLDISHVSRAQMGSWSGEYRVPLRRCGARTGGAGAP